MTLQLVAYAPPEKPTPQPKPSARLDLPANLAIDPAAMSVEWVQTPEALAALEAPWQELADAAIEPNPFYEPWMLLPALQHLRDGACPEVAFVWAPHPSGRKGVRLLCGVVPLSVRHGFIWSAWKNAFTHLTTPLLRAGAAPAALQAFLSSLEKTGRLRAGLLRFEDVPGSGPFRDALVDELRRREWSSISTEAYRRAMFRPLASASEFLEWALTSHRRKELRRLRARLGEQGNVTVSQLGPGEDWRPWVARFVELEARGWKGRAATAVRSREDHARYFEALCGRAAALGRLTMLSLELDGRPIAMKLNLSSGDGGFAFKIAYDEQHARFSPGVLLEVENIERLHRDTRVRWMDSCAAPNRFMINHLWPDRREMQTIFIGTSDPRSSLALALLPLGRWLRSRLRRRRAGQ